MPHPLAINEDKIVARAQQGNPDAIATMMNHFFNKKGIQVAVTRKPDALLILVEAAQVPSQEETLPPMQRALKRLGLDHIHEIQVYGRQQKALTFAWKKHIDLGNPLTVVDSATQSLQLLSWLNQGRKKNVDVAIEPFGEAEETIRFLRLYLNEKDTALIALEDIQSIFQVVPQQILRVPNLAEPVLGIYYHRGALVWLVDIGQQLDFGSCLSFCGIADTLTAIAISVGDDIFAFIVPRIATVETHRLKALRPVDTALFSPKLSPFIQTYVQNSVSPVLNPRAVLEQVYPQGHLH